MGREVRRVPLDFDWSLGQVWPGFMRGICDEEIEYAIGAKWKNLGIDEICKQCRHFGRLAGILESPEGCPSTKINPPEGPGWQLWETVSEGSPISPVFATAEELAQFLANGKGHPLGAPPTYEQALAFVKAGWAPTMVSCNGELKSGVVAIGEHTRG